MGTIEALGLQNNPVITGLWQVADIERNGAPLDVDEAATSLLEYAEDGFTCFDMADHYGSAELIAGAARTRAFSQKSPIAQPEHLRFYTKWCPAPHECTMGAVRKGIGERLERLNVECLDLLQLHWWQFEHPGYIDVIEHLSVLKQEGLIRHIGLTNFDTDHLQLLLAQGFEIASNQVCLSVLDQRALGDMSELCKASDVRLLAYGSLAGGFLSDKWLGQKQPDEVDDWSKMKYLRFIEAVGGWEKYQSVLEVLASIASDHGASLSNVAARWVLQQPMVAGVIVGARLTQTQHRESNHQLLSLNLTAEEIQRIAEVTESLDAIHGDCGTEYRRPPFLTASGDLSHHLDSLPPVYQKRAVEGYADRWRIDTQSEYESICGYCRAMRIGNRIVVSGTTATHGHDTAIGQGDARSQAVYILDKISASLQALGGSLDDVIRTRIYLTDATQWEAVSRVHGRYFANALPANTLIEISNLVGPYTVEIEAEAELVA